MVLEAKNPQWADKDHSKIIIEVRSDQFSGWSAYTADRNDIEAEGIRLWYDAFMGKYGTMADSDEERIQRGEIPPPEGYQVIDGVIVDIVSLSRDAEAELNRRLAEFTTEEAKARAELDEAYAAERKTKLAALLAVKQQAGWPVNIAWPDPDA
jgi:hypothetical protein